MQSSHTCEFLVGLSVSLQDTLHWPQHPLKCPSLDVHHFAVSLRQTKTTYALTEA